MDANAMPPGHDLDADGRHGDLPGADRLMLTFGADGTVDVSRREGDAWSSTGSHRIAAGGPAPMPDALRELMAPIRRPA